MKPTSSMGYILLASPTEVRENRPMEDGLRQRVKARLTALDVGAVQAATRAGLERTFIRDIIKEGGKQTVTARMLPKLAAALETTPEYLMLKTDDPEAPKEPPAETRSPVESNPMLEAVKNGLVKVVKVGKVEAGSFREVLEYSEGRAFLFEQPDPDYPDAELLAFDVIGNSMNAATPPIPEGALVLCVDFEQTHLPLVDGMIVVVERTRDGGHTLEWSIKQAKVLADRTEFRPLSTKNIYPTIVVPDDPSADTGEVVRVRALVRRVTIPVRRPVGVSRRPSK